MKRFSVTIDAAMAFLTNVDALIFDIRENGGGSPKLAQVIGGYLLKEPEELSEIYNRMADRRYQYWTLPTVAGTRLPPSPAVRMACIVENGAPVELLEDRC